MTPVPRPFNCATEPIDPGVCLLEASAGTGKTYALAEFFSAWLRSMGWK